MTDAIEQLVSQIYDAALDDEQWRGLESAIPRALDSTSISLMTVNQAGTDARFLLRSPNVTTEIVRDYGAHYHRLDVWASEAVKRGMDTCWLSGELVDDETLHRTEFYNDFLRRTETAYVIATAWVDANQSLWRCGIQRPLDMGTYDLGIKDRATRLIPHLKRALHLRERLAPLEIERRAALDALEHSGLATFVAAADGKLIYANSLGLSLLQSRSGLSAAGRRIGAQNRSAENLLLRAIHDAAGGAATGGKAVGCNVAIPRGGRRPLIVTVMPFRPARDGLGIYAPAAILLVRDPEHHPSAAALIELFGLTAAEARLTVSLLQHGSLAFAATAIGITQGSARQYMKRIFDKTGTRSQVELIALIAGSTRS